MCNSSTAICSSPRSRKLADMEICRHGDALDIFDLDPFLAELLRQIPASTNPEGTPAAEKRLFSPPADRSKTEQCSEWKLYVEPELRRLFRTAADRKSVV